MTLHSRCPRCDEVLGKSAFKTGRAICQCGWHDDSSEKKKASAAEKKVIKGLVLSAIALIFVFAHLASWGTYSLSIPGVKIQQMAGVLGNEGYLDLAQACVDLGKVECAKDTYKELYQKKADLTGLAKLATLYIRLQDSSSALPLLTKYFQLGGKDGKIALSYAKLLEQTGNYQAAADYYEFSVASRPKVLSIEATRGLVRSLMALQKYQEAKERIMAFHESAGNAKSYLNGELERIEKALLTNKTHRSIKRRLPGSNS